MGKIKRKLKAKMHTISEDNAAPKEKPGLPTGNKDGFVDPTRKRNVATARQPSAKRQKKNDHQQHKDSDNGDDILDVAVKRDPSLEEENDEVFLH